MEIWIMASDLPGSRHGASGDFPGYENIHVGVQRRGKPSELFELHRADTPEATWVLDCTTSSTDSVTDVTGPYIQGRPGERFIYLSWGTVGAPGEFTMFRRAKLMLHDVEPGVLSAAEHSGRLLARLGLTDPQGHPVSGRVPPPAVQWSSG